MKTLLTILMVILLAIQAISQDAAPARANALIDQVLQQLNKIHTISYHQTRDIKYYADHYDNHWETDMYMDFAMQTPLGIKFRAEQPKLTYIYTGHSTYSIDKENLTIDTAEAATAKSMQSSSFLYNSIFMVRHMLETVKANDSITRMVSDTMLNGKKYWVIKLERKQYGFSLQGALEPYTLVGLKRPYYLIVDRQSLMPYRLVARSIRADDDRDFVSVTYDRIMINPATLAPSLWQYNGYAAIYKPYLKPVVIPLVKTGVKLAGFTLPSYSKNGPDSISLKQFAGKIVLVDFWFKSCSPCMAAMPKYNALQESLRINNFQLLTVNVEDPKADIRYFYEKYNPVYPMLYGGKKLWSGLGFTACPSSVLLDKSGKVAAVYYGFDSAVIAKKVKELE